MAGGKETPRQKMIGMMYLVLTALLAMNVSKDILKGFVMVNESLERTNSNFKSNTKDMLAAFEAAINQGHPDAKPYYEKAVEATKLTETTFDYIDKLKSAVTKYTEDVQGADTMRLKYVEKKDDFDKPTYMLLGDDETNLKKGANTATELREKLSTLHTTLVALIDKMHKTNGTKLPANDYKNLLKKIEIIKPVDPKELENGEKQTWEIQNFYHMPFAAVITNLTKIQADIKNVEGEIVGILAGASSKLEVPMNVLSAKVVEGKDYIQAGQPYMADVFLSASSTSFKSENLQYILGDVDTLTGQLKPGATVLPIEMGTGKIQFPTSSAGHQTYKGWIKFLSGTGKYKYFPFKEEFIVANPAVSVSPEKMNVMYLGVDNPVAISAAGIAPGDLKINCSNGDFKANGVGKYIFNPLKSGDCFITVMAKVGDKYVQQGVPIKFRVKKLPTPAPKACGKIGAQRFTITQLQAQSLTSVVADMSGFDFDAKFKIVSYDVAALIKGTYKGEEHCNSANMSIAAKEIIKKVVSGSKVFISNIKAEGPDHTIYNLGDMTFLIQ